MAPPPEVKARAKQLDLAAWAMRKVDDMTHVEIASALGVSEFRARMRVHKGRHRALTLAFAEVGCESRLSPSRLAARKAPTRIDVDRLDQEELHP